MLFAAAKLSQDSNNEEITEKLKHRKRENNSEKLNFDDFKVRVILPDENELFKDICHTNAKPYTTHPET